jgi:hypothetical protein
MPESSTVAPVVEGSGYTPPAAPPPNSPVAPRCPNCGSALTATYCAECGEPQPSHRDLSLGTLLHGVLEEFTHLDGKVPRTLWALLTKPGFLTQEFVAGRRSRYTKPLSLFIVLNVVFFLVQPHTNLLNYNLRNYTAGDGDDYIARAEMVAARAKELKQSDSVYAARFDATLQSHMKSFLIFGVPLLAIGMLGLFARSGRYFVEHLVFSVHAWAFMLVMFTVGLLAIFYPLFAVMWGLSQLGLPMASIAGFLDSEGGLILVLMSVLTLYHSLAVRRAYGGGRIRSAGRGFAIAGVQAFAIFLYHDVLFYTAYYAT